MAVRWYLRYGLSYRDVEELLAKRGVDVDRVSVCWWVQTFTAEYIDAARPSRHATGDRWFVDETYVKVAARWTYLSRAIDQHGQVIDVLVATCPLTAAGGSYVAEAQPILKHVERASAAAHAIRMNPMIRVAVGDPSFGSMPQVLRAVRYNPQIEIHQVEPTCPSSIGPVRLRRAARFTLWRGITEISNRTKKKVGKSHEHCINGGHQASHSTSSGRQET